MSFPTSPCPKEITITSNRRALRSRGRSGREDVRKIGGQWWEFTFKYHPLNREQLQPIETFLEDQEGGHGTFQIVLPILSNNTGDATGNVNCTAAAVGSTDVSVSVTGTLKAGGYIKFSGHDKVYKIVSDLSGTGVMKIKPGLVVAVTSDNVIYNNVPFTVRNGNDIQRWRFGRGQFYQNIEIDFKEAI